MATTQPPQAAPSFAETPESLVEIANRLIARARKVQDEVATSVRPDTATFSNVLLPLAHASNALEAEAQLMGFFREASPDAELRAASREAQKRFDEFTIETATRQDIYSLVEAVWNRRDELDLAVGIA